MGNDAVEVRPARDESETEAVRQLRLRVFAGEQGVSPDAEIDGLDPVSTHLVALRRGGVVGTCRLRFQRDRCRLERMVVDPGLRRTGIGLLLADGAEREATRHGAAEMILHAQREVEEFYSACGYTAEGETFFEQGIPHVLMRKRLDGVGPGGT